MRRYLQGFICHQVAVGCIHAKLFLCVFVALVLTNAMFTGMVLPLA